MVRTATVGHPGEPVATHTPTARPAETPRPSASAHPSTTLEGDTATPTVVVTPAAIGAVQVSRSQVSAGDGQAVVVVAHAGTAITITVTYPSHIVASSRGTAGTDGVFRVPFTIPANTGTGLAQVRVIAPNASSSTAFAIT